MGKVRFIISHCFILSLLFAGGDSKTLMVVQIAPVEKNVSETVCSLNFAQRVRTVELGQATKRTETVEMANMKDRLRELEVKCMVTLVSN